MSRFEDPQNNMKMAAFDLEEIDQLKNDYSFDDEVTPLTEKQKNIFKREVQFTP